MVRLSHKCPWLTKKPKHSLERSFCGEWHEKIWVCGQPFLDSRNQSTEWSTGKRKVQRERKWFKNNSDTEFETLMWQIPLVFLLRFIHMNKHALTVFAPNLSFPQLLLFVSHLQIAPQIHSLLMYPELGYWDEHLQCWTGVWEQSSCLCSAYCLQPKTEKERAKQQPQVWPVCRMPGLLSGWQPPTHQGYTAVICWEEMLEIPNSTGRAHVTWNEEGKSVSLHT